MPRRSSNSVRVFYLKFEREEVIQRIRCRLESLREKLPIKSCIIFGSYAKGNYTVASDIDLLIVCEGPERENAYALCKKLLGVPNLKPHIYSEAEYEEMKQTIDKMTQNSFVLLFP